MHQFECSISRNVGVVELCFWGVFLSLLFDRYCCFLISDGSVIGAEVTESYTVVNESQLSPSTKSPSDPTMIFFTMDYGT